MLGRHILAKNAFYFSYAHKKEDVDYYLGHIKDVFIELGSCISHLPPNVSAAIVDIAITL